MRTYAGHSSPAESNALYRNNLSKGQTGLSVAFDLPTQTGYDPDDELAVGEVGKVGVPVTHIGDMRALFDGIPLDEMNTSMTINATAMWLLALYQAVAEEHGHDVSKLGRDDAERHHQGVPVARDVRVPARALDAADHRHGRLHGHGDAEVEPDQHLQLPPAGGRGDAGAGDRLRASAPRSPSSTRCATPARCRRSDSARSSRRISFFVNAGVRFVEEMCKMRAFTQLWDELTKERYGVEDPKHRRFRYGVQVNSLGLTEAQPENNVQRIVLEMLAVTLSKRRPRPRRAAAGLERGARACRGPGTSSGRCGCSRCWPTRPTCSSTRTCSPGRWSSSRRSPRSSRARAPRSPGCRRWAARSPPSSPAT